MENKLDPEFKKRWIEALRSGEYKQGDSVMYNSATESFCCLGVAAVLCGVDKSELEGHTYIGDRLPQYQALSVPDGYPLILQSNTITPRDAVVFTLASMNDSGDSFNQIADWIEQNL